MLTWGGLAHRVVTAAMFVGSVQLCHAQSLQKSFEIAGYDVVLGQGMPILNSGHPPVDALLRCHGKNFDELDIVGLSPRTAIPPNTVQPPSSGSPGWFGQIFVSSDALPWFLDGLRNEHCVARLNSSNPAVNSLTCSGVQRTVITDADADGIDDRVEAALLSRFRPYLLFSKDDGNESFNPADVVWYLRQSALLDTGDEDATAIVSNDTLTADPLSLLGVNAKYGATDILRNYGKTNYHVNPLSTAHKVSGDPGRHGIAWDVILSNRNTGLYGHVVKANTNYARGSIQVQDDTYKYIKIEYWQFFGYNSANKPLDVGDHEGDWATVQLLYDPEHDKIVKVFHYAHGAEMQFDMTERATAVPGSADWGPYLEYRGVHYGRSFDDAGSTAQNNTVRFYQDPETHLYTHPVVYIERGTHEFWPTENGVFHAYWHGVSIGTAPSHNGKDAAHRYLATAPPNLGQVESPNITDVAARVILRYNGYWGAYSRKNEPPPGPILHTEWTWPAASRIRPFLAGQLEN